MQDELIFNIEIQGKKLEVRELEIENSEKFLNFFMKTFRDLDFSKISDPLELIEKAGHIASKNFEGFAEAIFIGQDTKGINWKRCKLREAIRIINFFFKCNIESVKELIQSFQSFNWIKETPKLNMD